MRKILFGAVIVISVLANIVLAVSLFRSQGLLNYYQTTLKQTRAFAGTNAKIGKKVIQKSKQNEERLASELQSEKKETKDLQKALKEQNIQNKTPAPEYEAPKLSELQSADPIVEKKLVMSKLAQVVELIRIIDNSSVDKPTKQRLKIFEDMNETVVVNLGQYLSSNNPLYLDTLVKELRLITKEYLNI
jgi:hypothetical protein